MNRFEVGVPMPKKEEKKPTLVNYMKKELPENQNVLKYSYKTGVRAGFSKEINSRKPYADFTEVEVGEKITSSDEDEFMNVIVASDDDKFNMVKVEEQKGFEEPVKIEATQTIVKSDINKKASAPQTGSNAPLLIGLGILAYLGFKD